MNPLRAREGLALLARWRERPDLADRFPRYTGYLQRLSNGERLAAHDELRPLIADLRSARPDLRFAVVDAQCSAVPWAGRAAGTTPVPGLPHAYLDAIAVPTLLEQRARVPSDHRAPLWLALLPSELYAAGLPGARALLEEARRLAPDDAFVIDRLIEEHLRVVRFACHHLPRTLLETPATIREHLARARSLAHLLREDRRALLEAEALRHETALDDFARRNGTTNPG